MAPLLSIQSLAGFYPPGFSADILGCEKWARGWKKAESTKTGKSTRLRFRRYFPPHETIGKMRMFLQICSLPLFCQTSREEERGNIPIMSVIESFPILGKWSRFRAYHFHIHSCSYSYSRVLLWSALELRKFSADKGYIPAQNGEYWSWLSACKCESSM